MNHKCVVSVSALIIATGWAWHAEAAPLGQVGQSVSTSGGNSFTENTGLGSVSTSIAGSYSESWGASGSLTVYDVKARASAGVVGIYNNFSYTNGGDWYSSSAHAESGDILSVFDATHANSVVGITFGAAVHGSLSSWDSNPTNTGAQGSVNASLLFGEYNSSTASWDYKGGVSLLSDHTQYGTTAYGTRTPSFTYYLTLDGTGHGQLAASLNLSSYSSEGASKWEPSSGGVNADYYNTVSLSVSSEYGTTTVSSGGGWNVVSVTAVPEPETYAMMLAGLGLLGFMARRRKQKEAA